MQSGTLTHGRVDGDIRRVTLDHPWRWLSSGWLDMCSEPGISYAYGAVFTAMGFLLFFGLDALDAGYLILPLAFGFVLVAPAFAVGLYDLSRRLDRGRDVGLGIAFGAWRRNGGQIALVGFLLLLMFIAWVRLAMLEFMLFFGAEPPSLDGFLDAMLQSPMTAPFLLVGMLTGIVLAGVTFAMTAIAIPMLVDRPECDAMTAITTSLRVVRQNPRPMALWAFLIAMFTLTGVGLFFVGLMVSLPLIGHASWHAYRDLVEHAA